MPPLAVSVVLPVLNESRDLGDLLARLREQESPPGGFEVLVVDGGSTDGTRDLVRAVAADWPALRLLENPKRRSGPARNLGARHAVGERVLFVDGHCALPRRDYLVRLVDLFVSTGADCLCRPQPLAGLAEGPWARAIAAARHSPWGHNPGSDIFGSEAGFTRPHSAGAAYRREVLQDLGGYDERFDACEDVEFNHRVEEAGYRSYVHPDLAVEYRPRRTPGGLLRQMFRYGRGRGRLMLRHPRLVPWILVGLSLAGLLAIALAIAGGVRGRLMVAAAVGLWAGLLTVEGFRLQGPTVAALRVAVCLAAVHVGLVLGFLRGVVEVRRFRPPKPQGSGEAAGEDRRVYS